MLISGGYDDTVRFWDLAERCQIGAPLEAGQSGVACRLLLESASLDTAHRQRLVEYVQSGIQVRIAESLPMKLAVFDGENGMLALLDPVITRPTWTAVVFRHDGMGEAMKALFEERWRRGTDL